MGSWLDEQFAEYAAYHRHPINRASHLAGFLLIGLGALGVCEALAGTAGALALQAALAAVFVSASPALGAGCTVFVALLWLVGRRLPLAVAAIAWAIGVVAPAVTHVWPERRWSTDLRQTLRFEQIGPLWFLHLAWSALRGRAS